MYYHYQIIKERFDIEIDSANQTHKGEFELDKNARFVAGILITSNRDDLMFYRGTQKIQINDKEIIPEDFESKLLMAGINTVPDDRMIDLGDLPSGNQKLEVWYKDEDHVMADFTSYRVSIYVFSKIKTSDLDGQEDNESYRE